MIMVRAGHQELQYARYMAQNRFPILHEPLCIGVRLKTRSMGENAEPAERVPDPRESIRDRPRY